MNKLILTALSLSLLSTAAFAEKGADNARANWERSRGQGLQAAAAPAPHHSQLQAPADAAAREAFEAQVLKSNRANYHGR